MNSAHFRNIRKEILGLLNESKDNVKVAMAWFTSAELFQGLLDCLKRGVKVYLILLDDPINFMEYAPDFNEFIQNGGNLRIAFTSKNFMHHKFCIIDNKILISGSYNWTYYAETRNIENIFITQDKSIVELYLKEFDELETKFSTVEESPRYSWNEIEVMDKVHHYEMNEEIQYISKAQNKIERKIISVRPEVIISDIKLTPKAASTIGILYVDKNGNNQLESFIQKDTVLPVTSKEMILHHSLIDGPFICDLSTAFENNKEARWLISQDCSLILPSNYNGSVPIKFKLSLSDDGTLKADISCEITNKRTTISKIFSDLVYHE